MASSTAACWDDWTDLGGYLQSKLLELWEYQPEQSARALQQSLRRGWLDHLAAEDRAMPQTLSATRSRWGSFEETVDRLFVRVIVFAQETAGRYAQTLRDSRSFSERDESLEEGKADSEDGGFDQEASIDEIFNDLIENNFYQETADNGYEATPEDVPAPDTTETAATASNSDSAADTHPLSEEAEELLRHLTLNVKQCVIAREDALIES